MTEQELHSIELYLRGRMASQEKLDFEARMASDASFRRDVEEVRTTIIALRQKVLDDKRQLLQQEEKTLRTDGHGSGWNKSFFPLIGIAAILVLGVLFIPGIFRKDDTIRHPYLREHFSEYVLHETTRSGNTSDKRVTPEQERAYSLYTMQKFHKAIPLLEELWEVKRDTLALFYHDVSLIAIGKKTTSTNTSNNFNSALESLLISLNK